MNLFPFFSRGNPEIQTDMMTPILIFNHMRLFYIHPLPLLENILFSSMVKAIPGHPGITKYCLLKSNVF